MCGFVGFHSPRNFSPSADALVHKMGKRLHHRGPDDAGQWVEPGLGTALAFQRLAILELSDLGHQPMASSDGRFVLAFNGEIYNHHELRNSLEKEGHRFHGHSDSEVLLASICAKGLKSTLNQCVGMFAIALVDIRERRLQLARDRLGEKPLYYGWSKGSFFFGSELKAFRPHPDFTPEVDRGSLTLFLRYGYVPAANCVLKGCKKLSPGQILTLALDGNATPGNESLQTYWSIPKPEADGTFEESPEDCVNKLEELLRESIRMQMLADVPVGVFLSGGIDSSTVASVMQRGASRPIRTFTIGFPDAHCNESIHAEGVARHLKTDHSTLFCTDSELLGLVEQIPHVYCEPFADDSQLPTMALARMARQYVTVCLSGDGGDELFHGYGRYVKSLRRWQQIKQHPGIGVAFQCGIDGLSSLMPLLGDSALKRRLSSRLGKARAQWLSGNLPAFYRHRLSRFKAPDLYLSNPEQKPDFFDEAAVMTSLKEDLPCLSYLDLNHYLPDDLLVKVDRAAMAFSLETRMPLLDHRMVEFAARVPDALKRRNGRAKWPLRAILERYVPLELTERKKMGFDTPMRRWLRGPLKGWAEDLLAPDRLRGEGFFDEAEVRRLWDQHQSGQRDCALLLWTILMFQAWHGVF
jgi:asparagine synthase (glutamine-hydrolysing)